MLRSSWDEGDLHWKISRNEVRGEDEVEVGLKQRQD